MVQWRHAKNMRRESWLIPNGFAIFVAHDVSMDEEVCQLSKFRSCRRLMMGWQGEDWVERDFLCPVFCTAVDCHQSSRRSRAWTWRRWEVTWLLRSRSNQAANRWWHDAGGRCRLPPPDRNNTQKRDGCSVDPRTDVCTGSCTSEVQVPGLAPGTRQWLLAVHVWAYTLLSTPDSTVQVQGRFTNTSDFLPTTDSL
jgi:hypothetical protein